MDDPNPKEVQRLVRRIKERHARLGSEFTADMKRALVGAEVSFKLQGGCGPVANVIAKDGDAVKEFFSPIPDTVIGIEDIYAHLGDVFDAMEGTISIDFAFTSTPEGGGSSGGRWLACVLLTENCLHEMTAPITGVRSLGEWSLKTAKRTGR